MQAHDLPEATQVAGGARAIDSPPLVRVANNFQEPREGVRACRGTARRVGRPGSRGFLRGHLAIRMSLEVHAAVHSRRSMVRDIDKGHWASRTRTGQAAAVRWSARADVPLVATGAPLETPVARARGDVLCTTRSALKKCAVQSKSGHFRRTQQRLFWCISG